MALSMLEAIDRQWPGAHVTWVCGETAAPLVRAAERVNEVVALNDRKLLRGGVFGALSTLCRIWLKLLGKSFDLILTGHSDPRYRLLSLTALGKERRGFGMGGWGPIPGRFHGDEYVRLVTGVDGPEALRAKIPQFRLPLLSGIEDLLPRNGKPLIALAPGGAKNILRDDALRRWPLENYALLARFLTENGNAVLITGGTGDEWVREAFEKTGVVDLIGKTGLTDLVALYGKCQLLVTHDSGPLHLGVLAGTRVLALFGPTHPDEKVRKDAKTTVLWGGEALACRPCYDGREFAKCGNNMCLGGITPQRVYAEAIRLLGK